MVMNPPQSLVRELLTYDPNTGLFTWRHGKKQGKAAGYSRKTGYVSIILHAYGPIMAHRLAWIFCHGDIPEGLEIDHKDGNPANNLLTNLRLATSSEQKQNKRVQSNNRCGLKGAYYHAAHKGKKWRSQIRVDGKIIFLGYFATPEEAHAAYRVAAEKHFGEFARAA